MPGRLGFLGLRPVQDVILCLADTRNLSVDSAHFLHAGASAAAEFETDFRTASSCSPGWIPAATAPAAAVAAASRPKAVPFTDADAFCMMTDTASASLPRPRSFACATSIAFRRLKPFANAVPKTEPMLIPPIAFATSGATEDEKIRPNAEDALVPACEPARSPASPISRHNLCARALGRGEHGHVSPSQAHATPAISSLPLSGYLICSCPTTAPPPARRCASQYFASSRLMLPEPTRTPAPCAPGRGRGLGLFLPFCPSVLRCQFASTEPSRTSSGQSLGFQPPTLRVMPHGRRIWRQVHDHCRHQLCPILRG